MCAGTEPGSDLANLSHFDLQFPPSQSLILEARTKAFILDCALFVHFIILDDLSDGRLRDAPL